VAAVVALNLVLNSVGGCVVLVVVSVGKCYTTAHVAEEKTEKKEALNEGVRRQRHCFAFFASKPNGRASSFPL
jgi:hypothetical protein